MFEKVVSCFIALALVTLVYGDRHKELLASGYVYIDGVGYYAFGTGKNWMDAQTDCMSTNGRLAVINSEEELHAITSYLQNCTQETYVYGGYTNNYEKNYVTTEGIPLKLSEYTKWEAGSPSGSLNRCGGINTKTGELTDLSCYNPPMSYICEHKLWTDYTYVGDSGYYKLHTEGKEWAEAYEICESEGAHLLIINSQAEADAVMHIYHRNPDFPNATTNNFVYIGFRAVFEDLSSKPYQGTYLTVFGTSVSDLGYVKWVSGEPDVYDSYYCGCLQREGGLYSMTHCDFQFAFFCEKELEMFNSTRGTSN